GALRRNRRGRGLPGCGRGVSVPTSTKPKPSAKSPATAVASLSKPAASPIGVGKRRPATVDSSAGRRGRAHAAKRPRTRTGRTPTECASSGGRRKRSARRSRYMVVLNAARLHLRHVLLELRELHVELVGLVLAGAVGGEIEDVVPLGVEARAVGFLERAVVACDLLIFRLDAGGVRRRGVGRGGIGGRGARGRLARLAV